MSHKYFLIENNVIKFFVNYNITPSNFNLTALRHLKLMSLRKTLSDVKKVST